MTHPNVELANQAVVAVNETYRTGDVAPWRAHVERTFDPDAVLVTQGAAFTEGNWRGHDGMVGFVANQMEVLEGMWLRVDEVVEATDDRVVLAITFGGKARYTELEVELSPVHVFELRDGLVVRWQVFQSGDYAS